MVSQGFQRVTPTHSLALTKQYRWLLGERKFWADRSHHPRAAGELARLNPAIEALAKALPLVTPGVALAGLRPILFHMAIPLPGHALKRAVLAGLRKLGNPTLEELTANVVASNRVDLELHDVGRLSQRVQRVLDGLAAKECGGHAGASPAGVADAIAAGQAAPGFLYNEVARAVQGSPFQESP